MIELALRGRIAMVKDSNRRKYPLCDRYIEVINESLTGEVLLDEALKMMKVSEKMSVSSWIDLMSGKVKSYFFLLLPKHWFNNLPRRDLECHENRLSIKAGP